MDQREPNEYMCGAVASFVNTCITFPLNKIMFRQQAQGIRLFHAVREMRTEGLVLLYRGLLPPLLQRTATVSLMFGTYAHYSSLILRDFPECPGVAAHTVAALLAGSTEAVLAPFERIQVVLQVKDYHGNVDNTLHAFRTLARHGIPELYRGWSAVLLRNGPSNVLFLGLRDPLQQALPQSQGRVGQTVNAFISGAGLGAFLSTAFFPLNVIRTRMQARIGGPFLGLREVLAETLAERGHKWRKLFRGVHINYTRSFVSWGIVNAVYELVKKHFTTD